MRLPSIAITILFGALSATSLAQYNGGSTSKFPATGSGSASSFLGYPLAIGAPTPGGTYIWDGSHFISTKVPTLDSSGRVIPGGSLYGGVLGNDNAYNIGPAIYNNGQQVVEWWTDGGSDPEEIIGDPHGDPNRGGKTTYKQGNCLWGDVHMGSGDGEVYKNAGGCDNPMASLMLGIVGPGSLGGPVIDMEPDFHLKSHASSGGSSYHFPLSFIGGASSTNCGTGASFDPGSNDGAGRIVVGASPPASCKIQWEYVYTQVAGAGGWANSAPACAVHNTGARATGTITFNSNPTAGDTITIEGQTWRFWSSQVNPNDVPIGADAATTAHTFYQYYLSQYNTPTPGNPPGVDAATTHYLYTMPTSTSIKLVYTYLDGVTGNSVALSTSNATAITLPATLSGGSLPSTRTVVAQEGTGGMVITAPGGSLSAGDVLAYTCEAYW